jgi:hypothetical protein
MHVQMLTYHIMILVTYLGKVALEKQLLGR